ncbi:MAG: DUF72 domain-containing protein [Nitrososphaera sp.]|nr:DUF72 domain-containing protein [Nitrososphaera sp.]
MATLFGTSGWSYQEWVGAFYPNNRIAKLPFYSRIFDTVEVDSSFYRAPSKSMISGWAKATGPEFKFSLKLPKTITHNKRLAGVEKETIDFFSLVEPLARLGKLGCVLIQLPPSFTFKEKDRLESFFELLPRHVHVAAEFRHESWDRRETWELLKRYNVANTITDSPIKFLSKLIVTATTHAFVRWHGHGKSVWYNYRYSEEQLQPWVAKMERIEEQVPITYAYFNNHYGANAPANLLQLLRMRGEMTESQNRALARAERSFRKEANVTNKLTDFL